MHVTLQWRLKRFQFPSTAVNQITEQGKSRNLVKRISAFVKSLADAVNFFKPRVKHRLSEAEIKWYSMNLDQKVEEHEPIDLKRAIEIADQYLVRGDEKFKNDREAFAATMFGFSKSKTNFMEVCVSGQKQISYKFEFSNPKASWFQKLRNATFRYEDELHSRDKLIQKITDFFSLSSEQLAQSYKEKGAITSGRSPLGNWPNASIGIRIFTIIFFSILGAFLVCMVAQGIYVGKIWWAGGRYSANRGHWVYRDQSPNAYWIWVFIYSAISAWMIRGSFLELKIVKKMLKKRRNKKLD